MMILNSKSTSVCRGGQHGEASASHDNPKKNGSEEISPEAKEAPAVEDEGAPKEEIIVEEAFEEDLFRQSLSSNEGPSQRTQKGGIRMTSTDSNLPKTGAQAAKVLGNFFNDARVTNVLMLGLILIGMGGAEFVQTQACSL